MEIILKQPAIREVYHLIANLSSPLLRLFEPGQKVNTSDESVQPVFIVGAPRTGSTILYQLLTNELDVLYIDNLADLFHRNLYFGISASLKIFSNKAHNCFKSIEGDTWKCGLHAPSESGEFWYQYLPRERHYIDKDDVNDHIIRNFQKQIFPTINKFNKPFLFKNLNAGQRLELIHRIAPLSKFVFVRRNFIDTAFSILNSRRKLGITKNQWWSIKPKDYMENFGSNEFELIVNQIFLLEKQIALDSKLFGENSFIAVNYDEIYNDYHLVIEKISQFINCKPLTKAGKKEPYFKDRGSKKRNLEEEKLFLKYYQKFNWDETKIK